MSKTRLSKEKERFLLALHKGICKTEALKADLKLTHKKYQTIIGFLLKHKYIERLQRGIYGLLPLGKEYVTTYLEPALVLPFEDSKVQDFLTLFPEPYRGILRLTLSCCVAKRTKLFEAFKAGFPGTLLIGEAGIGKSPIGDTISWLQSKDPSDVKIDARLLTKGELGGRLEWYGEKGHRKRGLALSYWQKQDYAQIEEIDKVINRDVSGIIKVIAHAEKDFIREGKKYPNRTVPFLTMNIGGKQGQAALDKIDKAMGIPFIKRNNILFCNPYKGYLDDPSKFFRQVLGETPEKIVPALTLNVPILKTELSDVEFNLLARLIKEGMLPDIDNSHCDKRGVGIEVLAYHALTGNKDITSATYQIVKNRLQALESLGLVRDGWRDQFNREWLGYEGKDPEKADAIRRAIARQKELEDSIVVVDIPGVKHGEDVDLITRHEKMLDCLRSLREALKFPWTKLKITELSEYKLKELCSSYKAEYKGLGKTIQAEIEVLGKAKTEDNIRIGTEIALKYKGQVQVILTALAGNIQALVKGIDQGALDDTKRKTVVEEMKILRGKLNKTELLAAVNQKLAHIRQRDAGLQRGRKHKRIILNGGEKGGLEITKRAVETLRAKSSDLSSWLSVRIKRPKKTYPLRIVENDLATAQRQASPWLAEFIKDNETYLQKFEKRLWGGDDDIERPPDEPEDIFGSGGVYGSDLP